MIHHRFVRCVLSLIICVSLIGGGCSNKDAQVWCASSSDVSSSTVNAALQPRYLTVIDMVLKYCSKANATFYADVITPNSQAARPAPVALSLAPEGLRGNARYDAVLRQQLVDDTRGKIARLLKSGVSTDGGTDIFGAMVNLSRVLPKPKDTIKYAVIESDGLHVTADANLYTDPLDDRSIHGMIAKLRDRGLVPKLQDVKIYMVGIGVGEGAPDPRRQARLEVFWRQYFDATGATLVSYAKTLSAFP